LIKDLLIFFERAVEAVLMAFELLLMASFSELKPVKLDED